ncbi:MAG: 3'-5' exonuclease domain-containing protein 2 [Bacteroidetes bacterium]|uniref:3'-5' exonuclease domain-containing protein 2 n=1 Tax=Candidatus Caccoplasma merdipullorum TaxID=2840718 RepID=A0A9D9H6V3_9BACT|nr:3'-5' exonuclease domain-containing protein 2 [Candidatus Caccoplasma merdipullorum]
MKNVIAETENTDTNVIADTNTSDKKTTNAEGKPANDKIKISKEEVAALETECFPGRIIVAQTPADVKKGIEYLSMFDMVGIDTESKPSFKKGKSNKISLLQIATDECCILFRINLTGITDEIKNFFENRSIIKIGVSLKDDFLMLHKAATFSPYGFVEIQELVEKFNIGEKSLQKIYAILFDKKISKSQRLSNWDAEILSDAQKRYAATDAWASLKIYRALCNKDITECYRRRAELTKE